MKKIFLILTTAVVCLSASGQTEPGTTTIFPRLGLNLSKITDGSIYLSTSMDEKIDPSYKFGLTAGFECQQQFTPSLAASAGLLYSWQGTRWEKKGEYGGAMTHLHYLNVPLLLVGYVGDTGLSLKAGVQFGYLLAARNDDGDAKSGYRNYDIAIPVGVAYEFGRYAIDLRYHIGLTKPNKFLTDLGAETGRTRCIQLTVGYAFDL